MPGRFKGFFGRDTDRLGAEDVLPGKDRKTRGITDPKLSDLGIHLSIVIYRALGTNGQIGIGSHGLRAESGAAKTAASARGQGAG